MYQILDENVKLFQDFIMYFIVNNVALLVPFKPIFP